MSPGCDLTANCASTHLATLLFVIVGGSTYIAVLLLRPAMRRRYAQRQRTVSNKLDEHVVRRLSLPAEQRDGYNQSLPIGCILHFPSLPSLEVPLSQ